MSIRAAIVKNGVVVNVVLLDDINDVEGAIASETANIGDTWNGVEFIPADPVVPPEPPVWEWYIDVGPYFDRFREFKLTVLASTDPTIQALVKDAQVRKWIDLKRVDVQQSLVYIGSKIGGFTASVQKEILESPVSAEENQALRKLYF